MKTASYGLQPFSLVDDPDYFSNFTTVENNDLSFVEIVAGFVDMNLDGEGKELFYYRIDKQRPSQQSFRFLPADKSSFEFVCFSGDTQKPQKFRAKDRKFSLPPHHHFLFRLTPF